MKIIYLGTPDFAVKPLQAIHNSHHEIVAVVTQPDRLGNRNKLMPPPVKIEALNLNLSVLQYDKISRQGVDELKDLNADIMVTCAYGQILSQEILDICKWGVINIHASLLPKYRGSSPIQWAVINGEKYSGVTIMQTVKAVDEGDMIAVQKTEILPDETAGELFDRLSDIGASLIVNTLDEIESGRAIYTPQDHAQATYCTMLNKQDGKIDFNITADKINCFVRGMTPWPSAYVSIDGENIKVYKATKIGTNNDDNCTKIGTIVYKDSHNGLCIKCADGLVRLNEIQRPGGKRMSDSQYLLGKKIIADSVE